MLPIRFVATAHIALPGAVGRMSAINRYILFELVKVTLIALFGIDRRADVLRRGQSSCRTRAWACCRSCMALPFLLPYAVRTSLQGALLFAVCSVYGRMAATNEIVAIKSMGISPMQVAWPALLALGIPMSLALRLAGRPGGRLGPERPASGSSSSRPMKSPTACSARSAHSAKSTSPSP